MREPPTAVSDRQILAVVRREWCEVDAVEHLPVGFGAHHWKACRAGSPVLFVTYDRLLPKRSRQELEAAYAGAAAVARTLDFVMPSVPSASGRHTVELGDGAVSVTLWRRGPSGSDGFESPDAARETVAMLEQLHAADPPSGLPPWRPLVDAGLADRLAANVQTRWDTGPYGEDARLHLADHVDDVRRWAGRYLQLGSLARRRRAAWVATHGEPDTGNQLRVAGRRLLVDWESLKLAPPERDFRALVEAGFAGLLADVDHDMLEMFDLEWRLDEISQYADWFQRPHYGSPATRSLSAAC